MRQRDQVPVDEGREAPGQKAAANGHGLPGARTGTPRSEERGSAQASEAPPRPATAPNTVRYANMYALRQMGPYVPAEPIDMRDPQRTPSGQPRAKPGPYGEAERELIDQIRRLLEQENLQAALELFNTLHPADQGELLVDLPSDSRQGLLTGVPPEETADILELLRPEEAVQVSQRMEPGVLADILDEASADVAADVLRNIPSDQSRDTLDAMEEAEEVIPLLQYPDDTAGGLMILEHPVLYQDLNAANALDTLRLLQPRAEHTRDAMVVDGQGRLTGSLTLIRLALARPSATVRDIMDPGTISVAAETDQEDCARLMQRYDLSELPVVDQEGRLLGVILGEDAFDVVEEEATEDMYRMAGVGGETLFGPLATSLRRRIPWLYLNLGTVFLAAFVIALFESTIASVVVLAVFLPVVPGQGAMGGIQTLTLVVRSLALGELPPRRGLRLVGRELLLGLMQGLLLAIAVGFIAYLWKGNFMLGVVLGLAMLGTMVFAGLTGAGVPLVLRWLKMDPAVSAAVFITTFTDIMGLLLFLGLATALLRYLA